MGNDLAGGRRRDLDRSIGAGSVAGLGDAELLDDFVTRGGDAAEAAFEAIILKHGPMVFGVCRSVLSHPADAEDAFQATFLVLVRKAGSVRVAGSLGPWLYGVARRVARRARSNAQRADGRVGMREEVVEPPNLDRREIQEVVAEEVDRLPATYRAAVILCHFEGLSHGEAAEHLGWPVGTLSGRLSRARDLLRARLTRRGLSHPATMLASYPLTDLARAVPAPLLRSTVQYATSAATAGTIPASLLIEARGVLIAMTMQKLRSAAVIVATVALFAGGVSYVAGQSRPSSPVQPPLAQPRPESRQADGRRTRAAFLQEQVALARQAYADQEEVIMHPAPGLGGNTVYASFHVDQLSIWSLRWMEAARDLATGPSARAAAIQAHIDRLDHWLKLTEELVRGEASGLTEPGRATLKYARLRAEYDLAQEGR